MEINYLPELRQALYARDVVQFQAPLGQQTSIDLQFQALNELASQSCGLGGRDA